MTKVEQMLEEAGLKVPPFDEKDFIRKELISFKATLVLFAFSILVALACLLVWLGDESHRIRFLAYFVGAMTIGLLLLRPAYRLAKIDISHWKKKEWFGQMTLYFFFWLGFFLLLTNPPITDASEPVVEIAVTPTFQAQGEPVRMTAYVSDNVGLRGEPTFCLAQAQGDLPRRFEDLSAVQQDACKAAAEWSRDADRPCWSTTFTPAGAGTYAGFVLALDKHDNRREQAFNFTAAARFPIVEPPRDNRFVVTSEVFSVKPDPSLRLRSVQYRIDNGSWTNFVKDTNPTRTGFWITNPTFPGWHGGPNTAQVRALESTTYLSGGCLLEGGAVQDPRSWSVSVDEGFNGIGTAPEPNYPDAAPPVYSTPGASFLFAMGAVVLLAVALRRRTRDA